MQILTVASELGFSILGGILLCVVALRFKSLISNSISLNGTDLNLKLFPLLILFLIREIPE